MMLNVFDVSRSPGWRAVVGAIALCCTAFPAAAGCGGSSASSDPPSATRLRSLVREPGFRQAMWHESAPHFMRVADQRDDGRDESAAIVGTWRFKFISDGTAYPHPIPAGVVVDFGTQQWHSDGTEFTISGGRPPSSGDVCMGSWKKIGPSAFKLNHIALAWASTDSTPPAPSAVYVGPALIRAQVTVNTERTAFAGTFTLDQYASDEVTLLQHIGGQIVATRFNAD